MSSQLRGRPARRRKVIPNGHPSVKSSASTSVRVRGGNTVMKVDLSIAQPTYLGCIDLSSDDDNEVEIEVTEEHIVSDDSVVCVGSFFHIPETETGSSGEQQPPVQVMQSPPDPLRNSTDSGSNNVSNVDKESHDKESKIKCPICMDNDVAIKATGKHLCSTICGHIFCNICINSALQLSRFCPQCRRKLTPKQYHPVYI